MARPLKKSFDYFALDVDFAGDPKVIKLMRTVGDTFCRLVYIDLLAQIYGDEGYYMAADEETLDGFCWERRYEFEYLSRVIEACLDARLFDREMYETQGILTSSAIQERYITTAEKLRRKREVIADYSLVNVAETNEKEEETPEKEAVTTEKDELSATKKRKEKKRKEKKTLSQEELNPVEREEALFEKPLSDSQEQSLVKTYGRKQFTKTREDLKAYLLAKGEKRGSEYHALLHSFKHNEVRPLPPEPCSNPDCMNGFIDIKTSDGWELQACPICKPERIHV